MKVKKELRRIRKSLRCMSERIASMNRKIIDPVAMQIEEELRQIRQQK